MSPRTRPRPVFSFWAWLVLSPYLRTGLGGVEVVVPSPGSIAMMSARGFGLQDLEARVRAVSLTQAGADVVLRVVV